MPINSISWGPRRDRDIHVLRGQSTPNLSAISLIFEEDGPTPTNISAAGYMAAHAASPDVTLQFVPLFRGTAVGPKFVGTDNGITVNTETGVVTVAAGAPTKRKNNFIIEVTAQNIGNPKLFTEVIRVQIHDSVSNVWLSPDRLVVRPSSDPRPETTRYRFSLRAQFNDGVVGDLSIGHDVVYSSVPPDSVSGRGLLSITAANNPGDDVMITARLPAALGGGSAQAVMHVDQPWVSEPNPPTASIVVGGGWPGTIRPEEVPNVLMMGDGFTAGDKAAFERIANSYVHHVKNNRFTRPFDLLTTSMNFWKTSVPSADVGISVRSEVFVFTEEGKQFARPLPIVQKPPATGPWKIEHLMYVVGLPVPGEESKSNADLKAEWAQLVTPDPSPNLTDTLIDAWKLRATRAFIKERDGFPAISYGDVPAASNKDDYHSLDLHSDRAHSSGLKPFFEILASDTGVELAGGVPLGHLWATKTDPSFHFDNTDLILIISSFPGGRAVNGEGYMAASTKTGNVNIPVKPTAPGVNEFSLDLGAISTEISGDQCRTIAHELGHSFGLGDEYVSFDEQFPETEAELEPYANLQTDADARIAGRLNGTAIKWNWHRIRKAAVMSGPIPPGGPPFIIPLQGNGEQFSAGDTVLLRVRTFGKALQKAATVLSNTLPSTKELQIVGTSSFNTVTTQPAPGSTVTEADLTPFERGSLLYMPVPAPASAAPAKYATMVAKNIEDFISTDRPLTVVPCVFDRSIQKPILNGVSLPGIFCFKHKTKIVGLYSGGAEYSCGIYHPTGTCMMRSHRASESEFCAVCRYIMVDMIDPSRHFEIDRDYAEIYPLS
ncbi:MAG TPA: M64 family metallopeptidase [Pyrinomonadaceae bacterium]|nr:M64 family metallopeptidase [Pyrinomonadaceae bacterium]